MYRRHIVGVTILITLVLAGLGMHRLNRSMKARAAITELRDSVRSLRVATESCSQAVRTGEAGLRTHRRLLDSLHADVRSYETLEPRGVPADDYDEYMQAFRAYDDSTAGWDDRVAVVEAQLEQCRTLADAHNEAVESLREQLPQAGESP